jgi:hypothetical protein
MRYCIFITEDADSNVNQFLNFLYCIFDVLIELQNVYTLCYFLVLFDRI